MNPNSPPPKYGTRRNPVNPSFGARAAAVAEYLGTPFMPWQRQVADVVLEIDPARPGAWRYPLAVVSVPRQAGKTAWLRAIMTDRLMNYRRHEIMMTAQTGKDARKRWNQLLEALQAEKKTGVFHVRRSQGSEAIRYNRTGSAISPFAPTPKSLHGDSLHLVTIDEAWAFDEISGPALETAIYPTQLTVEDSQVIIVSTKGTAHSAYLNGLIERGRAAVGDAGAEMAYFEWSADEDAAAADPYSDAALAFHPAVGHTQTVEKIRAMAGDSVAAWRRSYLNLETATESTVIDSALWDSLAVADVKAPADLSQIAVGFDAAADRSGASIFTAWEDPAGKPVIALAAQAPGVEWLEKAIPDLTELPYRAVIADDAGPTRTVIANLPDTVQEALTLTKPRDYATACQGFLDAAKAKALTHDGASVLAQALAVATVRPIGGAVGLDPRKSAGPIDAARAAALALWGVKHVTNPGLQIF